MKLFEKIVPKTVKNLSVLKLYSTVMLNSTYTKINLLFVLLVFKFFFLSRFGPVHSVRLLSTSRCAFINYTSKEDCEKAIQGMHVSGLFCALNIFISPKYLSVAFTVRRQ